MNFPQRNKYLVLYFLGRPIYWLLALAVVWVLFSLVFFPKYFPASGAVLVCCALIGEFLTQVLPWRQDNELNKYLQADFVEGTVVSKSGMTLQLHAYSDEGNSPFHKNNTPSEIITFTTLPVRSFSGENIKTPIGELEPIFLLYQLATSDHTGGHVITPGTNQNLYIGAVEISGWEVRKTLRMVDVFFKIWITIAAVMGTLVWGYGDLLCLS